MPAAFRKKILIFGMNFHARAAYRRLKFDPLRWDVSGFVANENLDQADMFMGVPVFRVKNLNDLDFDLIVVAGRYTEAMSDVINRHGISSEKIWKMKRSEFQIEGDDLQVRSCELDAILTTLLPILDDSGIDHWFIASSLLALKRAQDLAWFADVDIAVPADDIECLCDILLGSPISNQLQVYRRLVAGKISKLGDIYKLVIRSGSHLILSEPAVIDFHSLYKVSGKAYVSFGPQEFLTVDDKHFLGCEKFKYKQFELNTPYLAESYLESTYGSSWRTPSEYFSQNDHLGRVKI
jgi:hypothetical protein